MPNVIGAAALSVAVIALTAGLPEASAGSIDTSTTCRDRFQWPFSEASIWNTPIGGEAEYHAANLFAHGQVPKNFHSDQEYFYRIQSDDPLTPWFNQGWWGSPGGNDHCIVESPQPYAHIPFPANATATNYGGNNAAGMLQPDNVTLLQMQPLYRCQPNSPVLARVMYPRTWVDQSILGNGTHGAHGGSGLSAMGGSLRLGELLAAPGTHSIAPIRHALKLELWAHQYYYGHAPGYHWPATQHDNYAFNQSSPLVYNGTDPLLGPGSLLAVPPLVAKQLAQELKTVPGRAMLQVLTQFGGYIVDDTAWDAFCVCAEFGLSAEFEAAYGVPFTNPPQDSLWFLDMLNIFRALAVVQNNSPQSVGGPGQRLAPLPPPICEVTAA